MNAVLEFLRSVVNSQFGIDGVLVLAVIALAVYCWYQHHRAKLLEHRIDLEAERRKAVAEELVKFEAKRSSDPISAPHARGAGAKRLLVVDDEEMVREYFSSWLRLNVADANVVEGKDGRAALEEIDKQRPDLLILDLVLPEVTGWDVLSELSKRKVQFPILVYTGYASSLQEVLSKANANLPNVRFMRKPSLTEELAIVVRQLLD
jgi:CheY-like chemotaxis protein